MLGAISLLDSKYPDALRKIPDPPEILYYKGTVNEKLFENCLGVVGSRRTTTYGTEICSKIVSEIANYGVTIVSGFMYGIDATAHAAAMTFGGKTIAVMPCGINLIRPAYQQSLYSEIIEKGGLIVSEYRAEYEPKVWMFPKRNRIIAGLCKAVLVVEAASGSGSLITAEYAFHYEREVMVVPQNVTAKNSTGIVELLKRGAKPVATAADVLAYFDKHKQLTDHQYTSESKLAQLIIEQLSYEPLTVDELARKLEVSVDKLGSELTLLILKGRVAEKESKMYVG